MFIRAPNISMYYVAKYLSLVNNKDKEVVLLTLLAESNLVNNVYKGFTEKITMLP